MSNVKLEIGDKVQIIPHRIDSFSDELILTLIKKFSNTFSHRPMRINKIENIKGRGDYVDLFYKGLKLTTSIYNVRYCPQRGDICSLGREVNQTNLNKNEVIFMDKSTCGIGSVNIVKKASDIKKEVKETPFEECCIILDSDLLCRVSKIGWNPKEGNILRVDEYSLGLMFDGHIIESNFNEMNHIYLTELGINVCSKLKQNRKVSHISNSWIIDIKLGLYDLFLTKEGVVKYKRFCKHPTEYFDYSTSLRAFCELFSKHMIKQ